MPEPSEIQLYYESWKIIFKELMEKEEIKFYDMKKLVNIMSERFRFASSVYMNHA